MTQVSFKIPKRLKRLIQEYIARDCHVNESDFFRDALREKIRTEAPELYAQQFERNA